jgi:hypothetical protein
VLKMFQPHPERIRCERHQVLRGLDDEGEVVGQQVADRDRHERQHEKPGDPFLEADAGRPPANAMSRQQARYTRPKRSGAMKRPAVRNACDSSPAAISAIASHAGVSRNPSKVTAREHDDDERGARRVERRLLEKPHRVGPQVPRDDAPVVELDVRGREAREDAEDEREHFAAREPLLPAEEPHADPRRGRVGRQGRGDAARRIGARPARFQPQEEQVENDGGPGGDGRRQARAG